MYRDFNKIQINYNLRRGKDNEIIEKSTMINIRCDDPDECLELYQDIRNKLNGDFNDGPVKINKEMVNKSKLCPDCGGELVQRIAKSGKKVGMAFLGCSNYSTGCKYTASC